jgi:hypothetical protein
MSDMKYMLLLTRGEWQESGSDQQRAEVFGQITSWFDRLYSEGKLGDGHQLQPPETATTVVFEGGKSVLIDRPLMEAKEAIGGYTILDAANLDEAITIVRSFPVPDGKVEVRPVVIR